MTHKVEYNGQVHEFPDEATPEMIAAALGVNYQQPQEKKRSFSDFMKEKFSLDKQPGLINPADIVTGAFKGMAKGGSNIAQLAPGAPDISNLTNTDKGSITEKAAAFGGQYAPAIASAGAGLVPSALIGAGYGASQSPESRIFGAITGLPLPLLGKIPGANKAYEATKEFASKLMPKNLAYFIQNAHDKLLNESSKMYDLVKNQLEKRGVSKVDVSKDLIEDANKYLPKTSAVKTLVEKAKTGDYEALHQLQSDLGKKGTKALGADLHADRNIGDEMLDLRDKINKEIRDKFEQYGHKDLVTVLDNARDSYKKLKDVYYKHPTIAKMVHHETRIIPKKIQNVLNEESKRIEPLLKEHPDIEKTLKLINRVNLGGKIAKVALPTTAAGTYLLDKFRGK